MCFTDMSSYTSSKSLLIGIGIPVLEAREQGHRGSVTCQSHKPGSGPSLELHLELHLDFTVFPTTSDCVLREKGARQMWGRPLEWSCPFKFCHFLSMVPVEITHSLLGYSSIFIVCQRKKREAFFFFFLSQVVTILNDFSVWKTLSCICSSDLYFHFAWARFHGYTLEIIFQQTCFISEILNSNVTSHFPNKTPLRPWEPSSYSSSFVAGLLTPFIFTSFCIFLLPPIPPLACGGILSF